MSFDDYQKVEEIVADNESKSSTKNIEYFLKAKR